MKKLIGNYIIAVGSLLASTAFAQKPAVVADSKAGWHRIAGLQADFKKQSESVEVLGNDEFQALKFRVDDAPIHIERMQVFYESGEMEDVDVKSQMKAGETSKVFELQHPGKDIAKVAFTYNTVGNAKGDKAEVEIYGLKSGAPSTSYNDNVDKAQKDVKESAKKAENGIERAAEKTGDAVSEAAAKTAAAIDDRKLDTKVGPNGQTIYVSDDGHYYYISEEGKKVVVTELQLKDK